MRDLSSRHSDSPRSASGSHSSSQQHPGPCRRTGLLHPPSTDRLAGCPGSGHWLQVATLRALCAGEADPRGADPPKWRAGEWRAVRRGARRGEADPFWFGTDWVRWLGKFGPKFCPSFFSIPLGLWAPKRSFGSWWILEAGQGISGFGSAGSSGLARVRTGCCCRGPVILKDERFSRVGLGVFSKHFFV